LRRTKARSRPERSGRTRRNPVGEVTRLPAGGPAAARGNEACAGGGARLVWLPSRVLPASFIARSV